MYSSIARVKNLFIGKVWNPPNATWNLNLRANLSGLEMQDWISLLDYHTVRDFAFNHVDDKASGHMLVLGFVMKFP